MPGREGGEDAAGVARPPAPGLARPPAPGLAATGLAAGYAGREVFRDVSVAVVPGRLSALIGPNGSGKTTLLHALCGLLRPTAGRVSLAGDPIEGLTRREIARRVALVAQFSAIDVAITVEETVLLGRYPRLGPLAPIGTADRRVVDDVLASLDLDALRDRPLQTLSGGERQRVMLARALAQETPLLLLDEPVASLDLRHQQETYELLAALAHVRGMGVLVADHHLNLVAATCDEVLVLHAGCLAAAGTAREVITEKMVRGVFGARMCVRADERGRPQCLWEF